jgi:hypothetical protein
MILQNLKQQVSILENIDYYRIKIRFDFHHSYLPASKLLSDSFSERELSAIENPQTKLVDIRDIDDDEQVSQLNINAEYFENDTELNQIYRTLVMLPIHRELTDRSGIFLSGDQVTIPQDTHTTKTYATIMDETAQSYADLNPIVLWSGGMDSTAILAAFVKNNINFSVTLDANTQAESPIT